MLSKLFQMMVGQDGLIFDIWDRHHVDTRSKAHGQYITDLACRVSVYSVKILVLCYEALKLCR